jgi:hypothetical protein
MSFKNNIYMILSIIVLVYIVSNLFNFIGIDFSSYGNYLTWVIALLLFFYILPSETGLFFKS